MWKARTVCRPYAAITVSLVVTVLPMGAEVVPCPTVPERTCQSDERRGRGRGISEEAPGALGASRTKVRTAGRGKPVRAAGSSVLKFDIAALFNRHLLERFHRALQQRDVVGIPRLAVKAAARGLGACDAFLLLADLATRQMFEGRGRNVAWGNVIGLACARAGERGEAGGKACAKAHDFARSGWWRRRHLHAAT